MYFEKLNLVKTGTSWQQDSPDPQQWWYNEQLFATLSLWNGVNMSLVPASYQPLMNNLYGTGEREVLADWLLHNEDLTLPHGTPYFKNGKYKTTFWRGLAKRFNHRILRYSPITKLLMLKAVEVGIPEEFEWLRNDIINYEGVNYLRWEIKTIEVLHEDGTIIRTVVENNHEYVRPDVLWTDVYVHRNHPMETIPFENGTLSLYKGETLRLLELGKIVKCSVCNTYHNAHNTHNTMFGVCSSCAPFPRLELEAYNTRANERFPFKAKEEKDPKFMGLELEYLISQGHNLQECLYVCQQNLEGHALFKRDGSVDLEICTAPATKDIHIEEFSKFFSDERFGVFDVQNNDRKSTGMHIHVDKRKMGWLTIGKLLKFMQSMDNKDFIHLIGERSTHYAMTGTDNSISQPFTHGSGYGERYRALNLQPRDTVEFRIFATPTTMYQFKKNLEFADAITTFCSPANSGVKELHHEDFKGWVADNRGAYKSLYKFMQGGK